MTQNDRDLILRVESKVERLMDKVDSVRETQSDHERRLRSVERWKYSIPIGMVLAIGTIIGAVLKGAV